MILWLLQVFSGLPADELTKIAHALTVTVVVGLSVLTIIVTIVLLSRWMDKE